MSIARVRALVLVSTLVVGALILVILAIVRDKQTAAQYGAGACPPNLVPVVTKPLPDESKIKLNVFKSGRCPF